MKTITTGEAARLSGWRNYLRNLWQWRDFCWFLAGSNLKARNASTSLGLLWWVLNPLIMAAVFFLVFGIIFDGRRGDDAFIAWLVSGVFVFKYTSTAITSGANSILANSNLLVNIRFPRMVLPLSSVIETGIGFGFSLSIYYLIAWPANGVGPGLSLVWLIPALVLHTLFNLGLALLTARLAVPFRDLKNLLPHLTRLWFYLSPVIWPLEFVANRGEWLETAVIFNPMYGVLSLYRLALMGRPIDGAALVVAGVATLIIGLVGVFVFVRQEGNMARYL